MNTQNVIEFQSEKSFKKIQPEKSHLMFWSALGKKQIHIQHVWRRFICEWLNEQINTYKWLKSSQSMTFFAFSIELCYSLLLWLLKLSNSIIYFNNEYSSVKVVFESNNLIIHMIAFLEIKEKCKSIVQHFLLFLIVVAYHVHIRTHSQFNLESLPSHIFFLLLWNKNKNRKSLKKFFQLVFVELRDETFPFLFLCCCKFIIIYVWLYLSCASTMFN